MKQINSNLAYIIENFNIKFIIPELLFNIKLTNIYDMISENTVN